MSASSSLLLSRVCVDMCNELLWLAIHVEIVVVSGERREIARLQTQRTICSNAENSRAEPLLQMQELHSQCPFSHRLVKSKLSSAFFLLLGMLQHCEAKPKLYERATLREKLT